ncbi:MAG: M20/M25/M40 family metallo-hydrolase [Anaerolineaceae bacterium]|nr:M20/M25/M40 family metallo-hydrolase [Anaerolineaceae bacterium]
MKPKSLVPLGVGLVVVILLAAACNLTNNNEPPTLVPRLTDTPQPTIGYDTAVPPIQTPQSNLSSQPSPLTAKANMDALLDQVDADHLFIHITTLQDLGTRHVNSPDLPNSGIAAAYRYVRGQFDAIATKSAGRFVVVDQPFNLNWAGVSTTQRNIIGTISGSVTGGGIIVLAAHYDSISIDPNDPSYPAPGANDDASGIAALIEIANILSQRPHRATILFVAFGAEEVGRMGSKAFINQYRNIPFNYMLNMDIIGSSTGPNGEIDDNHLRIFSAGPESSPSRQLARAVYWIDFTMTPDMIIELQDGEDRFGRYSDHMSFSEAGFAAIRFIESLEDRARQHTPQDIIGDVQATYLRRTTQSILAATTVLADGLPPPHNITLRPGTGTKRTLVWEPIPGATGYKIGLRNPGSLIINQEFPWNTNSVEWDGFYPEVVSGLVISTLDQNGMMGPPSPEFLITP